MSTAAERVVVTGIGVVTPLGVGVAPFWAGVEAGVSAASAIDRFDVEEWPTRIGCQVPPEFEALAADLLGKSVKTMSRAAQFASVAAELALMDAGLPRRAARPERAGVVLGTGGVGLHDLDYTLVLTRLAREIGEWSPAAHVPELVRRRMNPLVPLKLLPNLAASHLSIAHDLQGESLTVCTACTSGTQAIGQALRVLRSGAQDVVLAGATDAMVNPAGLLGFGLLGVLSTRNDSPRKASRPFDRSRDGFVIGEGAALLVLERLEHAQARGSRVYAELLGYGCAADAYRVTDEHPDARGSVQAMQRALRDAGISPAEVGYVNAHGTGTRMNDVTESRAIHQVFGPRAASLPVSSCKSEFGHLVAAAGAVETAATALALHHGVLPPSINVRERDPEVVLDVVSEGARPAPVKVALKNSFGFGGQNACLVLGRWEEQ